MIQYIYQRSKVLFEHRNCLRLFGAPNVIGNDSRVDFPASAATNLLANNNNFAFSFWVRLIWRQHSASDNRFYGLLYWGGDGTRQNASLTIDLEANFTPVLGAPAPSTITVRYRANGGGIAQFTSPLIAAAQVFSDWMHIVCQRDSTGGLVQLFVNATLLTSVGGIGGNTDIFGTVNRIGEGANVGTMDGYEDSMVLFDTPLSNAQITTIYNAGRGHYPPEELFSNVTGYWDFDDLQGTVATDRANLFNSAAIVSSGVLQGYNAERLTLTGQAWVDHDTLVSKDFYFPEYAATNSMYIDGINDLLFRNSVSFTNVRTIEFLVNPVRNLPQFFTENTNGSSWSGIEQHRFVLAPEGFPLPVDLTPPANAAFGISVGTNGVIVQLHRSFGYLSCPISFPTALSGLTHIAVTVSSDNRLLLYINGVLVRTSAVCPHPPAVAEIRLGVNAGFNSLQFLGIVRDFRIWNTQRTGAEIAAGQNVSIATPQTGLIVNCPMSRASALSATTPDLSGNAHDLTLINYILTP